MTKSLTTEQQPFVSASGTPACEGNVALISMPWVSAWIPSIQLAILRQCLEEVAAADTYEFFLDYAALISAPLYRRLCEAGGIIEEWLFAKHYFEGEGMPMPEGFLDEFPSFGLASREVERKTVAALTDVTADFLIRLRDEHDWSKYNVVAFTLTIYQTASSFALARLIKRKYPQVQIVFGGTSCADPAAKAMLAVCPYVDVAVRVEAEPVFAQLVRKIVKKEALDDIKGITFRDRTGEIQETPSAGLHHPQRAAALPNYDSYFRRFEQLRLSGRETIWVPFESSRGCWWGEKSQCTFCGLHEIMKYRSRAPSDVLEELNWLHQQYGVTRFYATDLIMPQAYYKTFLPELVRTKKDYEFFYELKANVTQEMMATLAAAGVKNLQPGLESLSTPVLKIMKKGVSATQNVQFLKWAAEYGLYVAWNIIAGMPGEDPLENEKVARNIPSLYHLQPPNYTNFELDRFSPCYERPEEFGIRNIRPLRLYRWIFPLPEELLRSLIYRFEYDAADFAGLPPWLDPDGAEYAASLRAAINEWHKEHSRGARLIFHGNENGEAEIHDSRFSENQVIYKLEPAAASLYQYLDGRHHLAGVAEGFAAHDPHAYEELGGNEGVDAYLLLWLDDQLLFQEDGYIVGLAVTQPARQPALKLLPQNEALYNIAPITGPLQARESHPGMTPRFSSLDLNCMVKYLHRHKLNGSDISSMKRLPSTRPAYLVELADRQAFFVKKHDTDPLAEISLYSAIESGELPEQLRSLLPMRHAYDPADRIVIYEGLTAYRSWQELLEKGDGFDSEIAEGVADKLSFLHQAASCASYPLSERFPQHNPIRTYDRLTIEQFASAPGLDCREFFEAAQAVSPLLTSLKETWKASHLVHGDFKADNVLLSKFEQQIGVRFVDWELAGWGDPLFDLGTAVGNILVTWLSSIPPCDSVELDHWLGRASISSFRVSRYLRRFTDAYFNHSSIVPDRQVLRRIWMYAGYFLLERGFVSNWVGGKLNLGAKLAMEFGAKILQAPDSVRSAFVYE